MSHLQVIIHSERLAHYMYDVDEGIVSVYKPIPNEEEGDDTKGANIVIDEPTMRSWIASSPYKGAQNRNLPSTFRFSIS